jgi:hypothetical protein
MGGRDPICHGYAIFLGVLVASVIWLVWLTHWPPTFSSRNQAARPYTLDGLPKAAPLESLNYRDAELVLGLVAPVGTDLEAVRKRIREHVKQFDYESNDLRLSGFLDRLNPSSLTRAANGAPYNPVAPCRCFQN